MRRSLPASESFTTPGGSNPAPRCRRRRKARHPKDAAGRFIPLFDGRQYEQAVKEWDEGATAWGRGEFPDYASEDSKKLSYEEWDGARPDAGDYMPRWTEAEATHLMMYEDTSEGTPKSPAFATPEELARWLADNGVSAFGPLKASYEEWLSIAHGVYAPSMIYDAANGLRSGVEASLD